MNYDPNGTPNYDDVDPVLEENIEALLDSLRPLIDGGDVSECDRLPSCGEVNDKPAHIRQEVLRLQNKCDALKKRVS